MMASRVTAMKPQAQKAASVYLEKVAAFRELLDAYEIGKRTDEGSVAAAARMVGLQVVDNRPK
jgi:hypothetical protein